jgi:polyhydroxybutyrate depolymerase
MNLAILALAATTLTWNVDGVQRKALVYPPSVATASPPVIFAFHGHGGTMETAAMAMRFEDVWPRAVVVYMQGLPIASHVDPAGLRNGWQQEPGQANDRDLKFFDAALATIRAKYKVQRVYVSGFSNGAIFSLLLWAERGKELAGIGVCAGILFPTVHPTVPRRLIHIAGELDHIAVYSKQVETMAQERAINGCSDDGQPIGFGATRYPSTKGAPVMTVIHRGGHVYPPNASSWIVKFFNE